MSHRVARGLRALAALVLSAGLLLQLWHFRAPPPPLVSGRLSEAIQPNGAGMMMHDEPLGTTEAGSGEVRKILNFDECVYRRFNAAGREFSVYAAYWTAGKVSVSIVAAHTPDRCWTENGMRCTDTQHRTTFRLGEHPLLPAEVRAFESGQPGGAVVHVAYWHVVGGRAYDYGDRFNAVPSPWRWGRNIWSEAVHGAKEQLFVRVASTTPLEQLWSDKEFRAVMVGVASLGLWRDAP